MVDFHKKWVPMDAVVLLCVVLGIVFVISDRKTVKQAEAFCAYADQAADRQEFIKLVKHNGGDILVVDQTDKKTGKIWFEIRASEPTWNSHCHCKVFERDGKLAEQKIFCSK